MGYALGLLQLGSFSFGGAATAALSTLNKVSDTSTPVLGFTVTYAVSNVLLIPWGPIIVAFS